MSEVQRPMPLTAVSFSRMSVSGRLARAGRWRACAEIAGFLAADLAVAHFLIGEAQDVGRREFADITVQFFEMGFGGGEADLLFEDGQGQRDEAGLAGPGGRGPVFFMDAAE